MPKIDGREVTLEGTDYAVVFEDWIYEARDQGDARRTCRAAGGQLVARDVYATGWQKVKS